MTLYQSVIIGWVWGLVLGLAINAVLIHSPQAAVAVTLLWAISLMVSVLYDEWRHPAPAPSNRTTWTYR